jgi:transcriptional regulator with XRE-family HTH domain
VSDLTHALGLVLRRHRIERRLSQEAFAERAGLHVTYVPTLEAGRRTPSIDTLARIAVALDLRLSALIAEVEGELGGGVGELRPPRRRRP